MNPMRMILAGAALLALVQSIPACGYGMPSPAARLAVADFVVVGKVSAIESRKLPLRLQKGTEPLAHTVEVIRVESVVKGDDRLTHVRLAVLPHQVMPVGYEACFFLTRHAEEPILTLSSRAFDYPIQKENNSGFVQQVAELKKMANLLRDPVAGLTSKDADERFRTAAMLVSQFRDVSVRIYDPNPWKEPEPIDPALSKLILRVLADTDWANTAADFRLTPARVFNLLGVTEKEGWNPQAPDRAAEAKRWLKENQDTFRIKAFVRRS